MGGMGQRVAETAHPMWFNTPVANPRLLERDRVGTDGDPEYAVWTPEIGCVYNGRAMEIFLPQDVPLPPASIDRIAARLALVRPFTCTTRITETRGPERLLLASDRSEP